MRFIDLDSDSAETTPVAQSVLDENAAYAAQDIEYVPAMSEEAAEIEQEIAEVATMIEAGNDTEKLTAMLDELTAARRAL
jgi:uncharacterized membrane protein affecting hemolysin expression